MQEILNVFVLLHCIYCVPNGKSNANGVLMHKCTVVGENLGDGVTNALLNVTVAEKLAIMDNYLTRPFIELHGITMPKTL